MKKRLWVWMMVLMICPGTTLAMEQKDLLAGVGFAYTPAEEGFLGGEYNLQYRYYRDRLPDTFESRLLERIDRSEIENAFLLSIKPVDRLSIFANIPLLFTFDDSRDNRYYDDKAALGLPGDIIVGIKFQATKPNEKWPLVNLLMEYRFNNRRLLYDDEHIDKAPIGRGYESMIGGIAVSKNLDPLTPFFTLLYSHHLMANETEEYLDGFIYKQIKPGSELQMEIGLTGSMTESVSYLASFDFTYAYDGKYHYHGVFYPSSFHDSESGTVSIDDKKIALIHIGAGLKLGRVLVNPRISFGLTDESPDFMFNLKIPF